MTESEGDESEDEEVNMWQDTQRATAKMAGKEEYQFKSISEMREEEEKLKEEINGRANRIKVNNMGILGIQAMREFLQKMSPEEENVGQEKAEEQIERKNKEMIQTMDKYNRATTGNRCVTDTFTIYEENGKEVCDVIFSIVITNRRLARDSHRLNYRIVYEVDEINVIRGCGVIDVGQLEESKEQGTSSTMESKPERKKRKTKRKIRIQRDPANINVGHRQGEQPASEKTEKTMGKNNPSSKTQKE